MKHFFLLRQYIKYLLKAKSAHGIHSPFVYDFITTVLEDKRHFYAFDDIKNQRNKLLSDSNLLQVEDFGAGSLLSNFKQRVVKDIAKTAGRNEKFGKLLFRIVDKYQCQAILELGTSLGIGTTYLASANRNANITTIEGSKEIADYANYTFTNLSLQNIHQEVGNFDTILKPFLEKNNHFDLVFIDGNHRKEPTIEYFKLLLQHCNESSILIFDDIHWSKGMHDAWEFIASHPEVTLSIDLFYFGIVFLRKEFKVKQHFVLKY